jgi:hypothetical protein
VVPLDVGSIGSRASSLVASVVESFLADVFAARAVAASALVDLDPIVLAAAS